MVASAAQDEEDEEQEVIHDVRRRFGHHLPSPGGVL
ncbi:uncharacterized, partial [Tachysurus ichikawai]